MMTLLLVFVAAAEASAAGPRPAEEPPADFAGRQYIDSTGCVFLREGKLWIARLGRDGGPVCGYPPTPVGHSEAAAVPHDAGPPPLDGMGRIEAELVTAITAGLAPGDLVGGPPASPDAAAAPPAGDGPGDLGRAMAAAIAASPAISGAASGGASNSGPSFCALLGIAPDQPAHVLGGDPTGGFCSGLAAPALTPRIAQVEASTQFPAVSAAEAEEDARPARRASAGATRETVAAAPAAGRQGRAAPVSDAGMIPAGTRFLQVGTYHDATAADAALRRVAALGLPVARSRDGDAAGRAVLAGPFGSRQAVVRAHDRLTRAGFRDLAPRR